MFDSKVHALLRQSRGGAGKQDSNGRPCRRLRARSRRPCARVVPPSTPAPRTKRRSSRTSPGGLREFLSARTYRLSLHHLAVDAARGAGAERIPPQPTALQPFHRPRYADRLSGASSRRAQQGCLPNPATRRVASAPLLIPARPKARSKMLLQSAGVLPPSAGMRLSSAFGCRHGTGPDTWEDTS